MDSPALGARACVGPHHELPVMPAIPSCEIPRRSDRSATASRSWAPSRIDGARLRPSDDRSRRRSLGQGACRRRNGQAGCRRRRRRAVTGAVTLAVGSAAQPTSSRSHLILHTTQTEAHRPRPVSSVPTSSPRQRTSPAYLGPQRAWPFALVEERRSCGLTLGENRALPNGRAPGSRRGLVHRKLFVAFVALTMLF